jgi:nitrile hydratase accessory protein
MIIDPGLNEIPDLPRDAGGPLFAEPWQLTAFSMVYNLYQRKHFEWREWVDCLSEEIAKNEDYGTEDLNTIYYNQWLSALERFVTVKQLLTTTELAERREAWRHADEHRGFGEPLRLDGHDHDHSHDHDHDHDHAHGHSHGAVLGEPICRSPARRLG